MRGQGYDDEVKEKAIALLSVNKSVSFVSRELNLPRSTINTWRKKFDRGAEDNGGDTIAELRQKNKEKFVQSAWNLIEKSQKILDRRLDRALKAEDELDRALDEMMKCENVTEKERSALMLAVSKLKMDDIKDISTVLGTMYDKQALASKEATEIVSGDLGVRFEDL